MNTLGKEITKNFYKDTDGFQRLETEWKRQIAEGFQPKSHHLLLYALLRGKDYRKGFTPLSNPKKLEHNGGYLFYPVLNAVYALEVYNVPKWMLDLLAVDLKMLVKKYLSYVTWESIKEPFDEAYVDSGVELVPKEMGLLPVLRSLYKDGI